MAQHADSQRKARWPDGPDPTGQTGSQVVFNWPGTLIWCLCCIKVENSQGDEPTSYISDSKSDLRWFTPKEMQEIVNLHAHLYGKMHPQLQVEARFPRKLYRNIGKCSGTRKIYKIHTNTHIITAAGGQFRCVHIFDNILSIFIIFPKRCFFIKAGNLSSGVLLTTRGLTT